jgi:hypothetical protein
LFEHGANRGKVRSSAGAGPRDCHALTRRSPDNAVPGSLRCNQPSRSSGKNKRNSRTPRRNKSPRGLPAPKGEHLHGSRA